MNIRNWDFILRVNIIHTPFSVPYYDDCLPPSEITQAIILNTNAAAHSSDLNYDWHNLDNKTRKEGRNRKSLNIYICIIFLFFRFMGLSFSFDANY